VFGGLAAGAGNDPGACGAGAGAGAGAVAGFWLGGGSGCGFGWDCGCCAFVTATNKAEAQRPVMYRIPMTLSLWITVGRLRILG
jgi:hypothetical protein